MGRVMHRITYMLLAICVLLWVPTLASATEVTAGHSKNVTPEISQIQATLPEVRVYLTDNISEDTAAGAQAWLGGESLTYVDTGTGSDYGTHYYLLLDTSSSMPDADFQDIKDGILSFSTELREQDTLSLYTFGSKLKLIYEGDGTNTNYKRLEDAFRIVDNQDQDTILFEAIKQTAQTASTESGDRRSVLVTITDGEDFAVGMSTSQEAKTALQEYGLPLFGIVVKSAAASDINHFGEFSRSTGGQLLILEKGECATVLSELHHSLMETSYIIWRTANNRADYEKKTLVITWPEGLGTVTAEMLITRREADDVAPSITAVTRNGDNKLNVSFSEPVLNAARNAAWKVEWDNTELPVVNAEYITNADNSSVELTFANTLYQGSYRLTAIGVTDDSEEENALLLPYTVNLEGEEKPEPKGGLSAWLWILVLIVIAVFFALCVLLHTRKRKEEGREEGIEPEKKERKEQKERIGIEQVDPHEFVSIQVKNGIPLTIFVDSGEKDIQEIHATIDRSLFFGRDPNLCNYAFPDPTISSQHFVLECEGRNLFVSDLDSTNATLVNQTVLRGRHQLSQGDVVRAGQLQFRFRLE